MNWTFPSRLIALGLRAFGGVTARKLLFVYGVRFAVLLGVGGGFNTGVNTGVNTVNGTSIGIANQSYAIELSDGAITQGDC